MVNVIPRLKTAGSRLVANLRPLALFNLLAPRKNYTKQPDLSYGPHARQRLDVYTPLGNPRQDLPVVIFFYGGSWQRGRRQDYRFLAQALTARGWLAVIPDYRVYPEVRFPAFVQDGAAAVAWVQANIAGFGGNPRRIFLMGHSAGAHIAAMLSLDATYLQEAGVCPAQVQGFIGLAGPYDFLPLKQPRLIDIFGGADDIPQTQPINFVSPQAPPALLLHGGTDQIVWAKNTRNLARRYREVGRPVTEIIYPHYKHLTILLYLAGFLQDGEPVMRDVAAFIDGLVGQEIQGNQPEGPGCKLASLY